MLSCIVGGLWVIGALCYAAALWKKEGPNAIGEAFLWPLMLVVRATHQTKEGPKDS